MLSRLANLHGVMRGMFPLQVIRYLRGSGVVERLNRGGEEGGGWGVQGKDKATETRDVWYDILALISGVRYENNLNKSESKGHVWCDMTLLRSKLKKCISISSH